MKVIMIGTGAAFNVKRAGPAVLLDMDGDLLLFDVGWSAHQNVLKSGYSPAAIEHLFLTHLHSDHTLGLPLLVLASLDTLSSWGNKEHWKVYGPQGTRKLIYGLFGPGGAFDDDIVERARSPHGRKLSTRQLIDALFGPGGAFDEDAVDRPESPCSRELIEPVIIDISRPRSRPSFDVMEITQPGTICSGGDWEVLASFAPKHVEPWLTCIAFRVNSSKGSVVITGDTGPHEDIVEFARGCTVLVHDCTIKDRTGWYANRLIHTDPKSLGWVAAQAEAKTVIGYHFSSRFEDPETLATYPALVAESFSGRFVMAEDLLKLDVATGDIL